MMMEGEDVQENAFQSKKFLLRSLNLLVAKSLYSGPLWKCVVENVTKGEKNYLIQAILLNNLN